MSASSGCLLKEEETHYHDDGSASEQRGEWFASHIILAYATYDLCLCHTADTAGMPVTHRILRTSENAVGTSRLSRSGFFAPSYSGLNSGATHLLSQPAV